MILRAPEGVGGEAAAAPGGEAAAAAGDKPAAAAAPESILFPKEGEKSPTDKPAGDPPKDGDKPAEGAAADWKEYTPDPAKSQADNDAAKAEHDKTKPAADDKGAADKVPEDGKYTLTMPEGIEVDKELVDALGPEFKSMNLTNAQAQKLADKFIETQHARGQKQMEGWATTISKWADDAKADKDIGGDKWTGTVANATRFTTAMGTPALKEYLNASGGGNHPELIRIFAKAGALIREDSPADNGSGGSGKPAEAAHILFPSDAPKGS